MTNTPDSGSTPPSNSSNAPSNSSSSLPSLRGLRIALLEARRNEELADLVRRHGGEPYSVPALRETPREPRDEVAAALDGLAAVRRPVTIFATGVGVEALFRIADDMGRRTSLEAILARSITVCRGPKPVAALKRFGMPVTVRAASPHTTRELLDAVEALDTVVAPEPCALEAALIVHHGERSEALVTATRSKIPNVFELLLYAWELPEDTRPLVRLVDEIIAGEVGAVAFTTQVHARHLVAIAEELGKRDALVEALHGRVTVVAIGPTCAETLRSLGIPPHIVPESPKMGPMVLTLARYLDGARSGL
ncbi:uroporphyrinogen-III synthase [Pendulispora albinea]|uniref:Uroporphyrinogen-III synthase n=1 Tax=Pendulispora albinea TaxID=2741071 RepID=A0ABZ2LUN9_9BACT